MVIYGLPNGLIYNLSEWSELRGFSKAKGNDIQLNIIATFRDYNGVLLFKEIYNLSNLEQIIPKADEYLQTVCFQIATAYANGAKFYEFPIKEYELFVSGLNDMKHSQAKYLLSAMIQETETVLPNGVYISEVSKEDLSSITNDMIPFEYGMIFYYKEPMGVYDLVYYSGLSTYDQENCDNIKENIMNVGDGQYILNSCDIYNYEDEHFEIVIEGLRADYVNTICSLIDECI